MLGLQRFGGGIVIQLFRRATYSTVPRMTIAQAPAASQNGTVSFESKELPESGNRKSKNSIVAAAFESLKEEALNSTSQGRSKSVELNDPSESLPTNNIDYKIKSAKTVNGLLAISETSNPISRQHALRIVSTLADWSSANRVKVSEFENDSRFLKICRVLGRSVSKNNSNNINNNKKNITGFRTDDLNTVLGVAGDDEAAKLIASISLAQMVKVMSTLAHRKRRSTPLLRSLAFNISSSTDGLDLKQCADVFYAMATLNFQDSVLAAKLCADVQQGLAQNKDKSAVVGSILTSLGILKYRDLDILESLSQWILIHADISRPQDISAYFYACAILNFKSANIEDIRTKLATSIVQNDFNKPVDWLNHVWCLALLGVAKNSHFDTVLSTGFLNQLDEKKNALTPTMKMKLLNLNSIAKLMLKNYNGSLLPIESPVFEVPLAHSKTKQIIINGMMDALKSLLPANNYINSLVDSRMGFIIDAVCHFDKKLNPLPLDKEHANSTKVALMIVDYFDVCHGTHRCASGLTSLSFDLLEQSGYKVIAIPYNEFNTSDKLLKRVQYLEKQFKAIVNNKNE